MTLLLFNSYHKNVFEINPHPSTQGVGVDEHNFYVKLDILFNF